MGAFKNIFPVLNLLFQAVDQVLQPWYPLQSPGPGGTGLENNSNGIIRHLSDEAPLLCCLDEFQAAFHGIFHTFIVYLFNYCMLTFSIFVGFFGTDHSLFCRLK